jgi:hypothetical protein
MSAHTVASPLEYAQPAGPVGAVTAARLWTLTGAVFVLAAIRKIGDFYFAPTHP